MIEAHNDCYDEKEKRSTFILCQGSEMKEINFKTEINNKLSGMLFTLANFISKSLHRFR